MDGKFIYVFSVDDRNQMIAAGFKEISSDDRQKIYVFENHNAGKVNMNFSHSVSMYVASNVLTF